MQADQWLQPREEGLYCVPADAYIDPTRPVTLALITHGHADHAISGHQQVITTAQTLAIMHTRYGNDMAQRTRAMEYQQTFCLGSEDDPVLCTFFPAGHILGSAQILLTYRQTRVVISGDYKRQPDPTCPPFQAIPCDVFITEATFALPVFRHPPIEQECQKLLQSLALFPERCHLVGVYALGKCQRMILGLRALGYDEPLYLHGAQRKLCDLYQQQGIKLGTLTDVSDVADKTQLAGKIVLAPPSALSDRWSRSLPQVRKAMASGWMQIRARAHQRQVELPLVVSDHCDWQALLDTIAEVNPGEVWITHGREDALLHQLTKQGVRARALSLIGYDEDATD
ncbi:ligase-associated DNA damage response exonuclease [Alteromonas lipolytica]|uniref:DNA ligase-associated DEXH box helicase n=1 Tax=Alteromonas lipolytica TaxID=1856405 RepID=A0A1E8FA16_9ALTE|nr:ligase-associated DNA damage response exonuclease [Alteromonas lipolytica]OFI32373.1 DNA ligase-associated DEXH box helicase [Alteromonas lipolytica]GGF86528.1 DNA ligase-associated DEXH box helicase [Alteromonas lipolytica]